nr:vegetative cell wall protein gp1-like [Lepeophtheirus salmonis]
MVGKFLIICLAVTCALADKPVPPPYILISYDPYSSLPPPSTTPSPPPPTTAPPSPPPTTSQPPTVYKSYGPYPPPPPTPPLPANYAYSYAVLDDESGVDIAADELAENGAITGSYKVVLPDGRIKTVTYTVEGDSGFVADVQFETTPALVGDAAAAPAPYPKYYPDPA